jgi:hypothetical protein
MPAKESQRVAIGSPRLAVGNRPSPPLPSPPWKYGIPQSCRYRWCAIDEAAEFPRSSFLSYLSMVRNRYKEDRLPRSRVPLAAALLRVGCQVLGLLGAGRVERTPLSIGRCGRRLPTPAAQTSLALSQFPCCARDHFSEAGGAREVPHPVHLPTLALALLAAAGSRALGYPLGPW